MNDLIKQLTLYNLDFILYTFINVYIHIYSYFLVVSSQIFYEFNIFLCLFYQFPVKV